MKSTDDILKRVKEERAAQDKKWGEQNHHLPLWATILGEEYGEFCQAVNETVLYNTDKKHLGGIENIKKELIQIAAVAIATIECIERNSTEVEK